MHQLRRSRTILLLSALTPVLPCSLACGSAGDDDSGSAAATEASADDGGDGGTAVDGDGDGDGGPGGDGADDGDGTSGADDGVDDGDTSDDGDTGGNPPACAPEPTFDEGIAPTAEIHVSPSGSDGGGCGSEGSPCATLDHAVSLASPGTAIRLHAGTYGGGAFIDSLHGSEGAPIWIGGVEGEDRPVFDGGPVAFTLRRPNWVVVHDLEIQNSEQNGINVDDGEEYDDPTASQHVVFRNLAIRSIGTGGNNDCLKLSGLNDFVVVGNDFSGCGGGLAGSGIDMVGCHAGVIRDNEFHDMIESGNAVQTKGGSEDVEIRGNLFMQAGSRALNLGGSTGFEFFRPSLDPSGENAEARNIRAIANVIVGSDAAIAFVGCRDCLAAHNTIVDPVRWVFRVLQETESTPEYAFAPSGASRIANNLVWFQRGGFSTVLNVGAGTAPETFEIASNLWYAHDAPDASDPSGELPVAESGAVVGQDPLLVDVAGGDVHVMPGSPAIGAGTAVTEAPGDFDGECFDDPPTIGAFTPAP
jgi:hypothetical protein